MSASPPRILLTHPGRQHSDRAGAALAQRGWLAGYWTGLPTRGRWNAGGIREIPPELITAVPWIAAMRRGLEALLPEPSADWGDFLSSRAFDRWAASRLGTTTVDAVLGYEVGCRRLFRRARSRGVTTVLDAAAIHPSAQIGRPGAERSETLARRVLETKRHEIEDADAILVVSSFARESYLAAGVPAEKIHLVPLGVDLSRFGPDPRPRRGPATFAFAGSTLERKGIRHLEDAFAVVRSRFSDARLRVAGAVLGPGATLRAREAEGWQFLGKLRGEALVEFYQGSDTLVLPSLEDSFGLVVAEALASGTPVLVTDRTGARDLVREGINGWVVPAGDASRLAGRLVWIAEHLDEVRAMRASCVESVREIGWDRYSTDLIETLSRILEMRREH